MNKEFRASVVIAQDGREISVNLPRAFFAAQSFMVNFDREDIVTGEPDDHDYIIYLILYCIDDNADVLAQYRTEDRMLEVFDEMEAAVINGQVYQLPPVENIGEEKGAD